MRGEHSLTLGKPVLVLIGTSSLSRFARNFQGLKGAAISSFAPLAL